MSKRFFLVFVLTLLPLSAAADDTIAPASGLGPQSVSGSAGGSNADAVTLQPAGVAPIQSSGGDSTGLTAPANSLQAPAAGNDQLQVLSGEADGTPHQVDDSAPSPSPWGWLLWTLLIAALAGAGVVIRDRRRFRHTNV